MRLALVLTWRPAFYWFGDSTAYLTSARDHLFGDEFHPAGYPLVLRVLHVVVPHLEAAIAVQHLLGLATGVLLFLTVRRVAGPEWLGLIPAAVVLLGGSQIFLEHAVLSEALFMFLEAGAYYAAVRTLDGPRPLWGAVAGLTAGAAVTVRWVGLFALAVVLLWLLLAPGGSGRRLVVPALAAGSAVMVLGVYAGAQDAATGFFGLSRISGWNLYGRAATFADCTRFTPPRGTAGLCETRPPSQRPYDAYYVFDPRSPAHRLFRGRDFYRRHNHDVSAFARAAILHQPLDYLATIPTQLSCYALGKSYRKRPCSTIAVLTGQVFLETNRQRASQEATRLYYGGSGRPVRRGAFSALRSYERATRRPGPLLVVALILGLGALAGDRRVRWGGSLLLASPVIGMLVTLAQIDYNGRYGIPTFGPLAASAALGGWALWTRFAPKLARRHMIRT